MAENYVMMQAFEWHIKNDGKYYTWLKEEAPKLREHGIDALWLPPLCKGTETGDVGYGIYDLYDLGEFDQKGSVRTKYGTVEELQDAITALHEQDIKVYADIILNHKASADFTEEVKVVEVDENDRNHVISEPKTIEAWTGFNFPVRKGKYSDFEWNHQHFSGVDYDQKTDTTAIYKIIGDDKHWADGVSDEKGNYDYLMFADINHQNQEVHDELLEWGGWLVDYIKIDGMRFDALKHIQDKFIVDFINHIENHIDRGFYFFGEYWVYDKNKKNHYLYQTKYHTDLFDVALHYHLAEASTNSDYDLRNMFENTLVKEHPTTAVTFVDNHDSQPGQSLESFVESWFKKIAYGLILLREDGYPCVFYGDYYGIGGDHPIEGHRDMLNNLIDIRKKYAWGNQTEYLADKDLIGWVRQGDEEHPQALAVLASTGNSKTLEMNVGFEKAGKVFIELTGNNDKEIKIDEHGNGKFEVGPGTLTCWTEKTE